MLFREYARKPMGRLVAVAAIALAAATSAQAMSPVPLHQADSMITQVRNCGPGQVQSNGKCVLRTTTPPVQVSGIGVKAFAFTRALRW